MFGLRSARGRAILAGMVLVLLLVAVGAVAVWRARLDGQSLATLDHTSSAATALARAEAGLWQAHGALSAMVISGDPALGDIYDNAFAAAEQNLAEARAQFTAVGEADKVSALDGLTNRVGQFNQEVKPFFPVIIEGDRQLVLELANSSMSEMTTTSTAIIADLQGMVQEAQQDASAERAAAERSAEVTLWLLLGLSGVALATGIGAVVMLVGSVVGPLAALRASARAITSGRPQARAKVSGPEEVASLARDFNEMTDALAAKTEAAQESERRYRLLAENASDHVWTMDLGLRYTYVSPSVTRMRGYTVEEVARGGVAQTLTPASLEIARKVLAEELAEERTGPKDGFRSRSLEVEMNCKDGSTIWCEVQVTFLRDEQNRPVGVLGVTRDISERKRAEEALANEQYLLHTLTENLPDHIYFKDTESRFTRINKAQADWLGLADPAQALGKTDFDFFSEEHARPAYEDEQRIVRTGQPLVNVEERETWPDRPDTWVSTTKLPLRDNEGRIVGTVGVSRDATSRKRAEEELRRRNEELGLFLDLSKALASSMEIDELVETALEGVTKVLPQADVINLGIYDEDGNVLNIKSAGGMNLKTRLKMAIKPGEGIIGKVFQSGKSVLYSSPEEVAAAREDMSPQNLKLVHQVAQDRNRAQSAICSPLVTEGRVLGSLLAATSDVAAPFQQADLALLEAAASHIAVALDKAQLHGQTKVRAITDGLTGLYNRAYFYERLPEEIERSQRYNGEFAVAMMDVDNFKRYNDSRGHQMGDEMLRLVAESIRAGLRRSDLAFRYGGDEFAAIMLHADAARARTVIDRINKRLAKSLKQVNDDAAARLSLSAGVACFGDDGRTADELVRVADAALYSAKWAAQTRRVVGSEYAIESLAPPPAMAANATLSTAASCLAAALREFGVPDVMAELSLRTIAALGTLAEIKDPYIRGHQERTSDWAATLAEEMGLSPDRVRGTRLAGLLHDLGKAGVSKRILCKPGKLTEEEFTEIKEHPPLGSMMITSEVEVLQQLVPIVRHHHEHFDGKGYPDGLAGQDIPAEARILAVVDAFDAMTHERAYRKAMSKEEALAELERGAGTQFDPAVVEAFLAWASKEGEGLPDRRQPAKEHNEPAALPTT